MIDQKGIDLKQLCTYTCLLTLTACLGTSEEKRFSIDFETIYDYGIIELRDVAVIDTTLLLLTEDDRILSVAPDLRVTKIRSDHHWKSALTKNDSLFLSSGRGKYVFATLDGHFIRVDTTLVFDRDHFEGDYAPLYEDEHYVMTECCFGEFGGTLFIQSTNHPNRDFALEATCPQQIIRKGEKSYYLINDLRHMSGHSSVIVLNRVDNVMPVAESVERYCNHYADFFRENMDGFDPFIYDSLRSQILGAENFYLLDSTAIHILQGYLTIDGGLEILYLSEGKMRYGQVGQDIILHSSVVHDVPDATYTYGKIFGFGAHKVLYTRDTRLDEQRGRVVTVSTSLIVLSGNHLDETKALTFKDK